MVHPTHVPKDPQTAHMELMLVEQQLPPPQMRLPHW